MSAAPAAALRFQSPSWVVANAGDSLRVLDLEHGDGFDAQGLLKTQLEAGDARARASLEALGALDPTVARFAGDYTGTAFAPLTRATLLRGTGFQRLFIELTAQCNERCTHCYAESSPERTESLEYSMIERALEDARRLNFAAVQLTGGDPLISRYCGKAALRARELGIPKVEIYTNGLALTDAVYAPLRQAGASFAFSFYSADPAIHDAVTRTPGSHSRTLSAIRRVAADGLQVRASIILQPNNAHTQRDTVAMLLAAGVARENIAVDQVREVGRGEYEPEVQRDPGQPIGNAHGGTVMRGLPGKTSIGPDGVVYPCIFSRKLPLGSLHERSLFEILTDERPIVNEIADLIRDSAALANEMTCWECKVRNVLLAEPVPLITLRSKAQRA